jgi:hypothetical protein
MLPPQELSNEWSCEYVSKIFQFLGNFYVLPLVTLAEKSLVIGPYRVFKKFMEYQFKQNPPDPLPFLLLKTYGNFMQRSQYFFNLLICKYYYQY